MPPNRVAFSLAALSGKTKNPKGSREQRLRCAALPRVLACEKRQIPDITNATQQGGFFRVDLIGKDEEHDCRVRKNTSIYMRVFFFERSESPDKFTKSLNGLGCFIF